MGQRQSEPENVGQFDSDSKNIKEISSAPPVIVEPERKVDQVEKKVEMLLVCPAFSDDLLKPILEYYIRSAKNIYRRKGCKVCGRRDVDSLEFIWISTCCLEVVCGQCTEADGPQEPGHTWHGTKLNTS